jgi:hypothetical protein
VYRAVIGKVQRGRKLLSLVQVTRITSFTCAFLPTSHSNLLQYTKLDGTAVNDIKGGIQAEGVREQAAKEDIWG